MSALRKLVGFLTVVENVCCTFGLLATTFMTFFQVLNRYWLQWEIIWINDLALFVFVFYMYFALILATRENGHIALDVVADKIAGSSPVRRLGYGLVIRVISLATVFVALFPAWRFAMRALRYPQYATLVRWFNISWLMEGLFAALCLIGLHILILIIEDVYTLRALRNRPAGVDGRNAP